MNKIKPCPFCGCEQNEKFPDRGIMVIGVEAILAGVDRVVECKNCLARGEPCNTKREAIKAWNRRR